MHNVFHVSLLKPHQGSIPLERAPVFKTDDNVYEVDRILAKRLSRNSVEYLVSWKGFNLWDATWEPLVNLDGCV